ncbi:hypothetical protein ACIQVC_33775 [Streptomyces sp. NPDC101112]|uniref:hypothetical protein n=1 Tax=Streptomyces sp. NPDC101112 TaxID=3366105 RepID=UPI0038242544
MRQVMIFAQGGRALGKIDFTENDESIDFMLEGDVLRIVPSYRDLEVYCAVEEFVVAGGEFIRGELLRVMSEYPPLARNPHVCNLAVDMQVEIEGV